MRLLPRGLVSAAAFTISLVVPMAPSPAVTAASAFPAPINFLRLALESNGGGEAQQVYTKAEAVALARRVDVIIGLRWTFDDYVAAMKAANPRLRMIVYMNGAMSKEKDRATMPEAWFMHDAAGRRINNLHFPLQYMDVGHPGWRNWVAARCTDWTRLSDFDGCFLDDMGSGNLGVNLSAWPIDPRTGTQITPTDWITYATGELGVVRQANPSKLIVSNGLNNGTKYFPPIASSRLLNNAHAAVAEGWLRNSTAPATEFRDVTRWKQDVDMVVDAGRRGRTVVLQTKLWAGSTSAQQEQWRLYTYASLLLGTDGYQMLNFDVGGPGKADPPHPYEAFNIGTPIESYALRGGVYQRRYSGGLAIVNPGNTALTVSFGGNYTMPNGAIRSSMTMGPQTGLVLRKP